MKNYFCYQLYDDDCGFACLKMLLAGLYKDSRYLYLTNPKENGNYTFLELKNISLKYGVTLKGYECYDLDKIKTPFIALIKGVNNNHYVLVIKKTAKKVYYNDLNFGVIKVKNEHFLDIFKGKYLLSTEFNKIECSLKINRVVPLLPILFISICELIFLVANCIFINNTIFYFLSILCVFILQFIGNIITRSYTINLLKRYSNEKDLDHNKFSKVSIHLSNYIALYMKLLEKIYVIVNLLIISMSNIIIINYIVIFVIFILNYCFNKFLIKEEKWLGLYEKKAFNEKNKTKYFLKVKKYLLKNDLLNIFSYAIYVLYKIIEFVVYKNYTYILISSFIGFYLLNKMMDLSKFIYQFKKRNIHLCYLNNTIDNH